MTHFHCQNLSVNHQKYSYDPGSDIFPDPEAELHEELDHILSNLPEDDLDFLRDLDRSLSMRPAADADGTERAPALTIDMSNCPVSIFMN